MGSCRCASALPESSSAQCFCLVPESSPSDLQQDQRPWAPLLIHTEVQTPVCTPALAKLLWGTLGPSLPPLKNAQLTRAWLDEQESAYDLPSTFLLIKNLRGSPWWRSG